MSNDEKRINRNKSQIASQIERQKIDAVRNDTLAIFGHHRPRRSGGGGCPCSRRPKARIDPLVAVASVRTDPRGNSVTHEAFLFFAIDLQDHLDRSGPGRSRRERTALFDQSGRSTRQFNTATSGCAAEP